MGEGSSDVDRRTVLIVEDDADVREVLSRLLQHEGFEVFTAADSTSGYEQLLQHEPAVVITDVMLPDYSGLEFIRWVRKRAGSTALPVIAMTAFEKGYLVAAQHLGADVVIHKPEGLDQLLDTVAAVLEKGTIEATPEGPEGTAI